MSRLRHLDISGWGWTVDFHAGRPGYLGVTDSNRKVVDIWIRDSHSVDHVLGTLAHELAHVYDREVWTPDIRDRWLALRGLDLAWWPTCTCDDRGFGAGDIAEAMVALEAGPAWWTGRHGLPTAEQLNFLASIV